MQHETVTQSVKRLDACVCLCKIVFSHSNEKLSHACVWVCVCLFEWSSLWPLNSWLLSVCLFTFSTNRTEGLSEHLALLLPSSKTFDVCSQQLCINGPEPIRSQIELLNTGFFEWHDDFVISEWKKGAESIVHCGLMGFWCACVPLRPSCLKSIYRQCF